MTEMLRKQILITEAQEDYLRTLSDATGESQGHIVRQAIDLHAQNLTPSSLPGLIYDKPNIKPDITNELKS